MGMNSSKWSMLSGKFKDRGGPTQEMERQQKVSTGTGDSLLLHERL
jgi:hypothetical protein